MDYNLSNYTLTASEVVLLLVVIAWDIAWRGVGLWRASRHNHLSWFVVILLINSVGILPIIYILTHRGSTK